MYVSFPPKAEKFLMYVCTALRKCANVTNPVQKWSKRGDVMYVLCCAVLVRLQGERLNPSVTPDVYAMCEYERHMRTGNVTPAIL